MASASGTAPGELWLRQWDLQAAGSGTADVSFAAFRVKFDVTVGISQTPNKCRVEIFNVSDSTASTAQREYTRLILTAGYQSNSGQIYAGDIRQAWVEKKPPETALILDCADGDAAYNNAAVSKTLASGSTPADHYKTIFDPMLAHNVTQSSDMPSFNNPPLPRAKTFYGMARDHARTVSHTTGSNWSVQNGVATVIPYAASVGTAIVCNPTTGMVGSPRQTNEGVEVTMLLVPGYVIGGLVQIDTSSIQRTNPNKQTTGAIAAGAQGVYKIVKIRFVGDTRGRDWYAHITGVLQGTGNTSSAPGGGASGS